MKNEEELLSNPGIDIDRHANQLYFASDTPPDGETGGRTAFSAVAVFGGLRARINGELRPGVAMSIRWNADHPEVARALIDVLREAADDLEKRLA